MLIGKSKGKGQRQKSSVKMSTENVKVKGN